MPREFDSRLNLNDDEQASKVAWSQLDKCELIRVMPKDLILLMHHVRRDHRYPLEAYLFVREGLAFATDNLRLHPTPVTGGGDVGSPKQRRRNSHVSGPELCEGLRLYAISQFGYLARTVLSNWGIYSTRDFGEIVFTMIRLRIMRKSAQDRKAHFDDVFDFEDAFDDPQEVFCTPYGR